MRPLLYETVVYSFVRYDTMIYVGVAVALIMDLILGYENVSPMSYWTCPRW